MKRRDFICGASCLIAGFALSELKNKKKIKNNNPSSDEYNPIEKDLDEVFVELASHCNLNCKGCDAFSPVSKVEFVTYDEFVRDFTKVKELYPNKDIEFLFIGGEPLLNPDVTRIVQYSQKLFPNSKKSIMTNGILLEKMEEDFWQTLKEANVKLRITKHPIDIDRSKGEKLAEKYGIEYAYDPVYTDKLYDLNTHEISKTGIEPVKGHYWSRPIIDISGTQDYVEKRYTCKHIDNGTSYVRGNLYFCWVHAHINSFKEYFNLDIPITKDDYLRIADVKEVKEIKEFLSSPKPLCRFCKQCHNTCFGGKPVEWEFSKRQISEWT